MNIERRLWAQVKQLEKDAKAMSAAIKAAEEKYVALKAKLDGIEKDVSTLKGSK